MGIKGIARRMAIFGRETKSVERSSHKILASNK
jgi:hypothetical protein